MEERLQKYEAAVLHLVGSAGARDGEVNPDYPYLVIRVVGTQERFHVFA